MGRAAAAETLIFGGKIDLDRAFLTFVLPGLLLPVIMCLGSRQSGTTRTGASFYRWLAIGRSAGCRITDRQGKPALTLIEPDLAVGCHGSVS